MCCDGVYAKFHKTVTQWNAKSFLQCSVTISCILMEITLVKLTINMHKMHDKPINRYYLDYYDVFGLLAFLKQAMLCIILRHRRGRACVTISFGRNF